MVAERYIDFVTTSHDHVFQCLVRALTAQFVFSFDSSTQHRRVEQIIGNKMPICHLILSTPVYAHTSLRLKQHYNLLERTVRNSSLTKITSIERAANFGNVCMHACMHACMYVCIYVPQTPAYKLHLFAQNFHIKSGMRLICENIWTML